MYSEIRKKIVSADESFLIKSKSGPGKNNLLFDCFLQKVYEGSCPKVFFLTPSLPQTYFLKEKAVSDNRFCRGYNKLNILTFTDFIKFFIRDHLFFSQKQTASLPVDQYSASRILFLFDILAQISLPEPYASWKSTEKFANNLAAVFTFFSDLSIKPDFLKKIKGYEWIYEVFSLYQTKSLENGFYFYDILPDLAQTILFSLPKDLFIDSHFLYIDDLQEIIPSQYDFFKLFISVLKNRGVSCRVFANYKPDYCLNTSKGASVSIIEKFIADFSIPRSNVLDLNSANSRNNRIYNLSESLLNYSDESVGYGLFDNMDSDNSIKCVQTPTYIDEIYYIASEINNFIKGGGKPSEAGVFVPKFDKNTVLLKSVINSYGIPVEFEFGDFIEKSVIFRFVRLFFNLVENIDSDEDVYAFLDSPVFDIASGDLAEIRKCADYHEISIFDASLRYCDKISDLKKRNIIRETLFFVWDIKLEDTGVPDIIHEFSCVSGLLKYAEKNEYTELNVLRRIIKAADFFVSFYSKLKNGKSPSLKDVINNQPYFMPLKIRNTNLEQLDSVKIVSLRSKTASEFKIVIVPNMNVQVFPNLNYERLPVLLNDISGKIPNLKKIPFIKDKNWLLNAVNCASEKIYFIYPKDSGEPSPLYDYIKALPYVTVENIDSCFAEYDNPVFIHNPGNAQIWAARRLANIDSENRGFIEKSINQFIPSVEIGNDVLLPELPLPVSLSEDHVFSATDIDLYLDCPRKFFLQRLIRIESELPENVFFGQLIHNVLELFHSVYPDWRGELSSDEIDKRKKFLFELLDRQVIKLTGFSDFVKRVLAFQAKNCFENYWDALMEENIKIYYLEKKVNFYLGKIPFTSKIDRIDDGSAKGGCRIIDYKTGSKTGKAAALKNEFVFDSVGSSKKSFQLPIYYFAAKDVMGLNVSELSKFYLQAKDKNKQLFCLKSVLPIEPESKSKQVTISELSQVRDKIVSYANQIQNGVYEKNKTKCYDCPCSFICG